MSNILFSVCLLLSFSVFSQENCNFSYSGIVLDIHDGKPVPFAKISIKDFSKGAISDSSGNFMITNLCEGEYQFICLHHIGCEPLKFNRQIQVSSVDTIYIEFHFQDLGEAHVEAYQLDNSNMAINKLSENEKRIGEGKNLGEALKQIPGVSTLSTGNSIVKPVIHGMHSNRIVILNNEIKQEGQQWGSEHAPEIDPFLNTELSLITGANTLKYGSEAIGGIIITAPEELKMQKGLKGKIQSQAFSNGRAFGTSAMLEGGFKKNKSVLSYRLQGTFRKSGTIQAPNYFLKNTGFEERNFSLNTVYRRNKSEIELFYSQFNTELGIFSGAHIGNLTDLQNAFAASKPFEEGDFTYFMDRPRQLVNHELFKIKYKIKLSEKANLSLIYGRQFNMRQEFDKHFSKKDSAGGFNNPAFVFNLTTHSVDAKYEHKSQKDFTSSTGVSGTYQKNSYEGRFFIPNFYKNTIGFYFIEEKKWKNNEIEFGIRTDFSALNVFIYENQKIKNYVHNFNDFNGSLGYSKLFNHHLVYRVNFGSAWRPPSINELYSNGLHHGAAAIEVGNRTMKIEKSYNLQTGFTYKSKNITAQLDVYNAFFDNYIYLKPSLTPVLTIKGAFPEFRFEQVNANLSGVDYFLSYRPKTWLNLSVKGAIVRAINRSTKSFIVGIPSDRIEPSVIFTSKLKNEQKISFLIAIPTFLQQKRVEENSDYLAPPEGYTLLNLNLFIDLIVNSQKVLLTFEVNNLLNTNYRDYLNRFRYFSDEIGRNLSLKITLPLNLKKNEK